MSCFRWFPCCCAPTTIEDADILIKKGKRIWETRDEQEERLKALKFLEDAKKVLGQIASEEAQKKIKETEDLMKTMSGTVPPAPSPRAFLRNQMI